MIKGEQDGDFFVILCTKCGKPTENEYLGRNPVMPCFKATCKKCRKSYQVQLDTVHWKGLPPGPYKTV